VLELDNPLSVRVNERYAESFVDTDLRSKALLPRYALKVRNRDKWVLLRDQVDGKLFQDLLNMERRTASKGRYVRYRGGDQSQ
jgi:hypothetical protein